MQPNQSTLENFYTAFARLDADTMAASYAADALFDDEVFVLQQKVRRQAVANLQRYLASSRTGSNP